MSTEKHTKFSYWTMGMSESQKDKVLVALRPSAQDELAKLPEKGLTSDAALAAYPLCRDQHTDEFFPENGNDVPGVLARICLTECPVKDICLVYGLEHEASGQYRHGLYGGLTPDDRTRVMKSEPASSAPEQVYELRQARLDRISKSKR